MARIQSQSLVLTAIIASICFSIGIFFPLLFPKFRVVYFTLLSTSISAGIFAFWKLWMYPTFFNPLRHIPGPKGGLPFIRYGFEHMKRPLSEKPFDWIKTIPNEGLIRIAGFFGKYNFMPTTPRVLNELLVTKSYDFQKPDEGREILRIILGDGLIVSEGDVHRFQRKNLNPMFSFRHIKDLYPLMWSKSLELVNCIKAQISTNSSSEKGYVIEVNEWTSRATLDIIGVAALGRNIDSLRNNDDELATLYEWLFRIDFPKKLWFLINQHLPRKVVDLLPWRTHREIISRSMVLRRVCGQLIKDKRNAMAGDAVESVDTLAHLIRSNNFSDQELIDQLLTFLAAGHETTSSLFTWVLSVLAKHPEYQNRVREELRQHVGTDALKENTQLASVLESLPWLNAICNETIRLFPTVPNTRRIAVRDTTLGGQRIPAGTDFIVPIWWLNRAPQLWGPNAADFCPERWIDRATGKPNNNGGAESNYALLTFLHGPRSCIGQGFARAELRALVAAWVLSFEFEMARLGEVLVPEGMVTVKPRGGLHLRAKFV